MSDKSNLSKVFSTSKELLFDRSSKIILMSDCHRGDGSWSDDLLRNQNIFIAALNYYYNHGYTYIEIGDGDELWENKKPMDIIHEHNDIFTIMSKFYQDKRLYLIVGNHDMMEKKMKLVTDCFYNYLNNYEKRKPLFLNIDLHKGIILKYEETGDKIFLVHGHQDDLLNDKLWFIAEFLVRNIWKPLELLGVKNPTSVAKNNKKIGKVEKRIITWSLKNNQMVIAGHTHKPVFPSIGEPLYFNDGSCVHPRYITGIEIYKGYISLIKWSVKTREDNSLYIDKDVIAGPNKLTDYFNSKVYKK